MNLPKGPEVLNLNCGDDQCACEMLDDLEVLRRAPVFSGAPIEIIKLYAMFSQRRSYKAGDFVLRQGDKADMSFLILFGELEVFQVYKDKPYNLQVLGKMGFFGELALLARFDWFFSVQARTNAEVLTLDRKSFQKIIAKFPEHQPKIIEKIVQLRIRRLENQMHYLFDNLKDEALRDTGENAPKTVIA